MSLVTIDGDHMKPIATSFRSHGYDFRMLDRRGDVALFEKSAGSIVSWEVVVVQRYEDREIAGNHVPAHEAMPGAGAWGKDGWTCTTLPRAHEKMGEVEKREADKAARSAPVAHRAVVLCDKPFVSPQLGLTLQCDLDYGHDGDCAALPARDEIAANQPGAAGQ